MNQTVLTNIIMSARSFESVCFENVSPEVLYSCFIVTYIVLPLVELSFTMYKIRVYINTSPKVSDKFAKLDQISAS